MARGQIRQILGLCSIAQHAVTYPDFKHLDLHLRIDATSFLDLCTYVVDVPDFDPKEVKKVLVELHHGYGEWLNIARRAIEEADVEEEIGRAQVPGVFKMATAFLYDIRPPKDEA